MLESSWPHLQVVYEFLLRFVVSREVSSKVGKRNGIIDHHFCLKLIHLFDSEDPRERDYLKTILHRVYGKFMAHRSFIRKQICYTFQHFAFETGRHNGIGELLEILGSIINGFALPLKKEHLTFLHVALIPLHRPKCVALYHQQLSYCIVQYAEKDASTAHFILEGIFKYWPWTHSSKQVAFLNEVEELLEVVLPQFIEKLQQPLMQCVLRCLCSEHFQVVERTLFLWNNDQLVQHCFCGAHAVYVLPIIFETLEKNSTRHWNATVRSLAEEVSELYKADNSLLWSELSAGKEE